MIFLFQPLFALESGSAFVRIRSHSHLRLRLRLGLQLQLPYSAFSFGFLLSSPHFWHNIIFGVIFAFSHLSPWFFFIF